MRQYRDLIREQAWRERRDLIASGIRLRAKVWSKTDESPQAARRRWRRDRQRDDWENS